MTRNSHPAKKTVLFALHDNKQPHMNNKEQRPETPKKFRTTRFFTTRQQEKKVFIRVIVNRYMGYLQRAILYKQERLQKFSNGIRQRLYNITKEIT